jgi:hypothetical protein
LKELENGMQKYNKEVTGPKFNEKWAKLVEKTLKAEVEGDDKEPKAKAMSGKDMKAELDNGTYTSELGVKLTRHHMGVKDIDDLKFLDSQSYMGDLVRKFDSKLWSQILDKGKAIEQELKAKAAKVAAEQPKAEQPAKKS